MTEQQAAVFTVPQMTERQVLTEILLALLRIERKVDAMSQDQSHLDTEVAQLAQEEADLGTALGTVQTEIAALKAAQQAGQPVDFTALDQHVAALQDLVTQAQQAATDAAPPQ